MSYNPFSLAGKTILVTGASSGIGQACAIEASRMGASVIICGRNKERLDNTLSLLEGNNHYLFEGDLLEHDVIIRLINELPVIDGVVFSAGKGLTLPYLFSTRDRFDDIFNINFFSPVELLRLLTKKKKISQNSSVVFIVSIGGTQAFSVGNSIYGASKSALLSIVKFAALELAPKKIRVNGICPGMVNTPLIHSLSITDEQFKTDIEKYPLKRYGEPKDIAYGAVYLLSDASSWMTGSSLTIDGGITIK